MTAKPTRSPSRQPTLPSLVQTQIELDAARARLNWKSVASRLEAHQKRSAEGEVSSAHPSEASIHAYQATVRAELALHHHPYRVSTTRTFPSAKDVEDAIAVVGQALEACPTNPVRPFTPFPSFPCEVRTTYLFTRSQDARSLWILLDEAGRRRQIVRHPESAVRACTSLQFAFFSPHLTQFSRHHQVLGLPRSVHPVQRTHQSEAPIPFATEPGGPWLSFSRPCNHPTLA